MWNLTVQLCSAAADLSGDLTDTSWFQFLEYAHGNLASLVKNIFIHVAFNFSDGNLFDKVPCLEMLHLRIFYYSKLL